jgi:hypothetical protein
MLAACIEEDGEGRYVLWLTVTCCVSLDELKETTKILPMFVFWFVTPC